MADTSDLKSDELLFVRVRAPPALPYEVPAFDTKAGAFLLPHGGSNPHASCSVRPAINSFREGSNALSLDRPPFLVGWVYLPRFSEELASRLFERLLIQLHSSQEHFIDFVIDLRQRQIDFTFQVRLD